MGISGLLPQLRSVTVTRHISDYRGCTVAIDGYSWLHKGVYNCSQQLCMGEPTDAYVHYCITKIDMLLHHGVIPYMVFDGGYLPSKAGTEEDRGRARDTNKQQGLRLLELGKREEARQCFGKAVDVSPYMAFRVIQALKQRNVQYVVAPYEVRGRGHTRTRTHMFRTPQSPWPWSRHA
jgi:exonuclease-1